MNPMSFPASSSSATYMLCSMQRTLRVTRMCIDRSRLVNQFRSNHTHFEKNWEKRITRRRSSLRETKQLHNLADHHLKEERVESLLSFNRRRLNYVENSDHSAILDSVTSHQLRDIYAVPDSVILLRRETTRRVQEVIQRTFGPKYTVELFGSTRYGVSHPTSDLDMIILDPARPCGFQSTEALPGIYNMRRLGKLFSNAGFRDVQVRPWGAVPIVMFRDPKTRLNCDINVNERLGLFNSDLIKRYCELSSILRPMLYEIKTWAKPLGLNNPSGGDAPRSFSSYALTLMTIGFLQAQGLLPNLQVDILTTTQATFWPMNRRHGVCHVGFDAGDGWKKNNAFMSGMVDLPTILRKWFLFWGREFNPSLNVMDVRRGGLILEKLGSKQSTMTDEQELHVQRKDPLVHVRPPRKREIVVLDPFITSKNVATAISNDMIALFRQQCLKAAVKPISRQTIVQMEDKILPDT